MYLSTIIIGDGEVSRCIFESYAAAWIAWTARRSLIFEGVLALVDADPHIEQGATSQRTRKYLTVAAPPRFEKQTDQAVRQVIQAVTPVHLACARQTAEFLHGIFVDLQIGRRHVFFEMRNLGSSRDRQHHQRSSQEPSQRYLRGRSVQLCRHTTDRTVRARYSTGRQREPRNKSHLLFFAVVQHIFRSAVSHAVTILHTHNWNNRLRVLNLRDADFRQTNVFDFSLRLQILKSSQLIFGWNLGINSVQLIEINPFQPQSPKAAFARRSQVLWLSVFDPLIRTRPHETALGRDHQTCRIWMQGLSDDLFAHVRTIGVRSVDKIDSQLDCAPQNADSLCSIRRFSPNSFSGDSHCAESQSNNAKIFSDHEFAGASRQLVLLLCYGLVRLHVVLHSTLILIFLSSLQYLLR